MEFLLLNEVLKNLIFFQLPIKKSDFKTLILSKFPILNANLWSILANDLNLWCALSFMHFEKLNFSDF